MHPSTSRPSLDSRALVVVLAAVSVFALAALVGVGPLARADGQPATAAVDGPVDHVYVVTGADYPDALAAATIAAAASSRGTADRPRRSGDRG